MEENTFGWDKTDYPLWQAPVDKLHSFLELDKTYLAFMNKQKTWFESPVGTHSFILLYTSNAFYSRIISSSTLIISRLLLTMSIISSTFVSVGHSPNVIKVLQIVVVRGVPLRRQVLEDRQLLRRLYVPQWIFV